MKFDPNWHPEGAACAAALDKRIPGYFAAGPVDWMIVGGSGIGKPLVEDQGEHALGLEIRERVALADLELPVPSVAGHGTELVFGELAREGGAPLRVCVQTGRIHPYEGHPASVSAAPLGAVLTLGCARLLLTSAVGGIDPKLRTGAIVSYRDQFNLFGPTPLRGPAFVGCSNLYDRTLRAQLRALAEDPSQLPEVVYGHARGPQYESPAEVAALRSLGCDVVGMSTTYEAVLAAAHGVPTCGLGLVTNAAGADDLSHEEVFVESNKARGRLAALVRGLLLRAGASESPTPA
ncbi:purine-nucleoside phosphorylase [Pseudenhygromyxa sp. WMMC2535]|uniref:purine-nucleoside phosphorylase n=1 Tax=Pseudenhygromyxa sp. WMMC2535 TaxID=2712867 RepID=UPI001553A40C|nr:purine-nucleoside phosphorylase [Pseudenhygromyxa sp. WMMC2535]NVB36884.1 purine-nucleoside phosphorylase [Pseudenhygromyxa sp. WMMC2535]